jgi:beta-lactamase class A
MVSNRKPHTSFQRPLNWATYSSGMVKRQPAFRQPVKRSHLPLKFKLWAMFIIALGITGHFVWSVHASAQAAAEHQAQMVAAAEAHQKAANFASQVNATIAANPNDSIGVATGSNTQGLQTYGDKGAFDGASTAKLLTAVDYLHHVQQGTARLDTNVDGQTAGYWLKIMLVNSDDTAWSELNSWLTHDDLQAYATSIGFSNYDPDINTFTANDIALLLQKLYTGQLLDSANRALMLRYMGLANYRQYIVAAAPAGDSVYHKVGLDEDTINDSAIISNGQKYVVLVIFTNGNGTYNWPNRTQLIHTITKDAATAYL